ncbi:MAG: glycosyltransferase family 4 protein, partial [Acidobacteriota bacterium]
SRLRLSAAQYDFTTYPKIRAINPRERRARLRCIGLRGDDSMAGRKEKLLCVVNFPSSTGYAWDFISGLYARVADHLEGHGIQTFVAYPSMPSPPKALAGSAAKPIVLDTTLTTSQSVRATTDFIRHENVKAVYFTDRYSRHWRYLSLRRAGVRWIVVHDHTSGEQTRPRGLKRVAKWVLARIPGIVADKVITVSEYVARRQIEVGLISRQRVITAWNGVSIPPSRPETSDDAFINLGVAPGRPLVICACRAAPEKGVAHLLRAFDRVLCDGTIPGPQPLLLFLGDGPQLGDLRALRENLRSKDNIILAGYRPDARELLESADLCVVPSVWQDAFPLAVMEAMARAKPVIATRVGGIPEMIEHGVHGILVPPGDELALASAIRDLLGDRQVATRLGQAARQRVAEHFSPDQQLRRILAVLEEGFGTTCEWVRSLGKKL